MAIHPNDWISIHAVAAKTDEPHCDSCHRRQSFCVSCHERTGVGNNADAKFFKGGARIHPPTAVWVGEVKGGVVQVGPLHHGVEAARNISSCASCHREEQCLRCHSAQGTNAPGATPVPPFDALTTGFPHQPVHPKGFGDVANCREMVAKNAQACRKCHTLSPNDSIARCFVPTVKGSAR